jgi:hypothetical protein
MRHKYETGFTESPYFNEIIDPYREKKGEPNMTRGVHLLPVQELARLFELLPDWNKEDAQNSAPTIRELLEIGQQYPGTVYSGYTVGSERSDERLSIDCMMIPLEALTIKSAISLAANGADEISIDEIEGSEWLRLWWD